MSLRGVGLFSPHRVCLGLLVTIYPFQSASLVAEDAKTCVPRAFSRVEAEGILRTIPQVLVLRPSADDPSLVEWSPGATYRTEDFFFFEVLASRRRATVLDNGVIGYFGVNKSTGEVLELNSPRRFVWGPALERLQNKLRAEHLRSAKARFGGENTTTGEMIRGKLPPAHSNAISARRAESWG